MNGAPSAMVGVKHVSRGVALAVLKKGQFVACNAKSRDERTRIATTSSSEVPTAGILHGVRRGAELLEGNVAVLRVQEHVPVLIAHGGWRCAVLIA